MIIPIRCFSCGKVIGQKYERYRSLLTQKISSKLALEKVGLTRTCCRRMFLAHVSTGDKLLTMHALHEESMQSLPIESLPRAVKRSADPVEKKSTVSSKKTRVH